VSSWLKRASDEVQGVIAPRRGHILRLMLRLYTLKQKDPFPESSVKGVDGIHLKIKKSFGEDLTTSSKRG